MTKLAVRLRGVITDIEKLLADTIGRQSQREQMTVLCAKLDDLLDAAKAQLKALEQADNEQVQDAACATVYEKLWQAIGIAMKIESGSCRTRLHSRTATRPAGNNPPQHQPHLGGAL